MLLCSLGSKSMRWPAFLLQEKGIYIKICTFGIWKWNKNSRLPGILPSLSLTLSSPSLMSSTSVCSLLYSPFIPKWLALSFFGLYPRGSRSVNLAPVGQNPPFRLSHWLVPSQLSVADVCSVHLCPVTYSDKCFLKDTVVRTEARSGCGTDGWAGLVCISCFLKNKFISSFINDNYTPYIHVTKLIGLSLCLSDFVTALMHVYTFPFWKHETLIVTKNT